jgi:SIR2-like domain
MAQIVEIEGGDENVSAFLEPYIQSGSLNFLIGSGASFPAIKIAGNVESEINALLTAGDHNAANRKSLDFIEAINTVHAKINKPPLEDAIKQVVEGYSQFVSLVDSILFARKNLLLPRQATIFTTNYDMFMEHAASLLPGVILNDGFDRSSSLNSAFAFAPERFFDRTYRSGPLYRHHAEIPTLNLVKLHGSLSWRRRTEGIVFDPLAITKLTPAQKADATQVETYLKQHFLILPNFRKFHATLIERVYYDLLRLFSKAMDQENAVLISFGFSFADEHILDITRRALRNPTSHLVIFSYDKASSTGYQAKFSMHRNVTIISPKAGSTTDFTRLNDILKSVISVQHHAS